MQSINTITLSDFPHLTHDKLRFSDTDALGHVNNAVFSTFLETGRAELLLSDNNLHDVDCTFVIVNLNLNFRAEIRWPGNVEIGTGISKIGNSSITFYQCVYQNGLLVADAETTVVQMHTKTRKSSPLTLAAKAKLQLFFISKRQ